MKLPFEIFYDEMFKDYEEESMTTEINDLSTRAKKIRVFDTGATRDTEEGKLDFEGFLSPIVIERFAEYMHKYRKQSDGKLRDSDNWQKGIPKKACIKSLFRHFMDFWKEHRGYKSRDGIEEALCGIIFNSMGYLFEIVNDERKRMDEQLTGEKIRAFNKLNKENTDE